MASPILQNMLHKIFQFFFSFYLKIIGEDTVIDDIYVPYIPKNSRAVLSFAIEPIFLKLCNFHSKAEKGLKSNCEARDLQHPQTTELAGGLGKTFKCNPFFINRSIHKQEKIAKSLLSRSRS